MDSANNYMVKCQKRQFFKILSVYSSYKDYTNELSEKKDRNYRSILVFMSIWNIDNLVIMK